MSGRTLIGIILVILGAAFLLDQLAIIKLGVLISTYWPLLLIAIGVYHLVKKNLSIISGLVLTLIGLYAQLKKLNLLPPDTRKYFWPVSFILLGLTIILSRTKDGKIPSNNEDRINNVVVFSGLESRNISQNFKGGNITAIFGGAELDFNNATLSEEGAFLDLTAVFGGIQIKVPSNWKVVVSGVPIFGGWENKIKAAPEQNHDASILRIRCLAMFGGITIDN